MAQMIRHRALSLYANFLKCTTSEKMVLLPYFKGEDIEVSENHRVWFKITWLSKHWSQVALKFLTHLGKSNQKTASS